MKKTLFNIASALVLAALTLVSACKKGPDYSGMAEPEFSLIIEHYTPDMNVADNIPVVCVIRSEAGLQKVNMFLGKLPVDPEKPGYVGKDGDDRMVDEELYASISTFNDLHQFSLKENPKWSEDIIDIRIEAIDLGGRSKSVVMPVTITPYTPAPTVVFDPAEILIDETTGSSESPTTHFTVTSDVKLASVEVNLFRRDGIEPIGLTPGFQPRNTYSFEQDIAYQDGDTALQVAATDEYGKVKIETLNITYIPVPKPEVTANEGTSTEPIIAHSGDVQSLSFHFVSEGGAVAAKTLKFSAGKWTEIIELAKTLENENEGDYDITLPAFESNWGGVKVQVIDRLGRIGEIEISTIIDMRAIFETRIGAQAYAKQASEDYPDAYPFFSVADFKSYSLYDAWENTRMIDFVFYYFNGGEVGGNVRFYDPASATRPEGEWPESRDVEAGIPWFSTWSGRNATTRRLFDPARFSFDFDTVTADDLLGTAVQNRLKEGQVTNDFANFKQGAVVLFKTGPLSTCPNATGIIRFDRLEKNTTSQNWPKGYYIVSIKVVDKQN